VARSSDSFARIIGEESSPRDFDFIVAYELYSDTAYVYSYAETRHNAASTTVTAEAAERWDKVRAFLSSPAPLRKPSKSI